MGSKGFMGLVWGLWRLAGVVRGLWSWFRIYGVIEGSVDLLWVVRGLWG